VDGWSRAADAPGRKVRKHEVWTKPLDDGSVLRTAISKGRAEHTARMTNWIIKHELRVTEQEFWAAVRDGVAPVRPETQSSRPPGDLLPLSLVKALLAAGLTTDELRGLTEEQARRLLGPP
jgi:hypothetical protein